METQIGPLLISDDVFLDSLIRSTIVAIYEIGCFLGSLVAFAIGERLGRRKTIRLGSAWMIVGALLQTFAKGRPQMIAGRIISGIGMGTISQFLVDFQHIQLSS